jgi:hypothetical protein
MCLLPARMFLTLFTMYVSASHFLPGLHDPGYYGSLYIHYRTRSEENIDISPSLDLQLVQLGSSESLWTSINLP